MSEDGEEELTQDDKRILKYVADAAREEMPSRRGFIQGSTAAAALGALGFGAGSATAQTQAAGQVGTENNPVDVEAASVNAGDLSVEDESGTPRIAQMAVDGAVVPIAPGLGAEDAVPISNDNPINEAINKVANTGAADGAVVFTDDVRQLQPLTTKSNVSIFGTGQQGANVTIDSGASVLFRTDGNDVRRARFSNFLVSGDGVTNHTATAIDRNTARWIDCKFDHLSFGNFQGQAWYHQDDPAFQTTWEHIHWYDIDAGDASANEGSSAFIFEWDGAGGAPVSFRDWAVYPTDTVSGSDSGLFVDGANNAGGKSVSIDGYLNIGGSAGTLISQQYNSYTVNGHVNWEPSTQNSTPSALVSWFRNRPLHWNGTLKSWGTVQDLFSLDFDSGKIKLPNPYNVGTINRDIVRVNDQGDTIQYDGVSSDVNNASGGTLSPGVNCLGDNTLVT